jgi:hypothetical protein
MVARVSSITAAKRNSTIFGRVVGQSEVIQFDGLSAFRPCGRDLMEFFNSTSWAFHVNLSIPPTSGWRVIRTQYGNGKGADQYRPFMTLIISTSTDLSPIHFIFMRLPTLMPQPVTI